MSKISTYPSADTPLLLSDRLIGTEAIRTPPSKTPLATKNFSLGELLELFSTTNPTVTLQGVLNVGNTATQNITLIGTIDTTLIKPVNIEDPTGSQGTTFQYLSKGTSSISWIDLPIYDLQQVLDKNNSATKDINLTGNFIGTSFVKIGGLGSNVLLDNGDTIALSSIESETTSIVTADLTVGAIEAQDVVQVGTNLQEFIEQLLSKTFNPILNPPSFSLTNDAGLREIGSSDPFTLTFNFNRGSIVGKTDGGVWQPSLSQGPRAGASISYRIDGNTQFNNTLLIADTLSPFGNSFNATVTYGIGQQPLNSKNGPYLLPLEGATSQAQSTTVQGIYPYFYYKSSSPITAASMQAAIVSGDAEKVLGDSNGTLSIPYNVVGKYMAVAYPNASTAKTKYFVTVLDAGVLGLSTSPFNLGNVLNCNSPDSFWSNIPYRIHVSPILTNPATIIELRNP